MRRRLIIKKLLDAGFVLKKHGGNHDTFIRGNDIEQIPRHREIDEFLARRILKKWGLK